MESMIWLHERNRDDLQCIKSATDNPHYDSGCTHCHNYVAVIQHHDGIRCVLNPAQKAS